MEPPPLEPGATHKKGAKQVAQTSTIQPDAAMAVLKWQVIETNPFGSRWVIAAFDVKEDAEAFVTAKTETSDRHEYELREDPAWAQLREERELRRPAGTTPVHEVMEP